MQNDTFAARNLARFLACKGQFLAAAWVSFPKPAAAFKGVALEKRTRAVVRAGVDFAKLAANESREVGALPWGEWAQFPYTIAHNGKTYLRLYPVPGSRPQVEYFANGAAVSRDEFLAYLRPSDARGGDPLCFTVSAENCTFPEPAE